MLTRVTTPKRPFLFADKYTSRGILEDPAQARAFQDEYLKSEAEYFSRTRDPRNGLSYDGIELNPETGEGQKVRNWSAPSKECLDLGILVKALEGDPGAAQLLGQGNPARARAQAVAIMARKLAGYQQFHQENPGYAGYLPWYFNHGDHIEPTPDWQGKIPGLDNGEWVWSMLVAEKALRDQGFTELAADFADYNKLLADNATRVFYDAELGVVRGDVRMDDPKSATTGYHTIAGGMTGEHGVHEGAMLLHYVTLFGKDLPEGAADRVWEGVTMKRVEHAAGTTWQGYWGSAHESWAYLFLPMRDHPAYRDLFRIREEIRSQNASDHNYPGFATSTNEPGGPGYLDGAGIEGVGSQPIRNNHTFAVYGAFPMLLEFAGQFSGNFGLAYLHNMLTAPRMQGPLGGGESGTNDGSAFCPMKTIDGTLPNLLAVMGGLESETADLLKERGLYQTFMNRLDHEYEEAFGSEPLREPVGFALTSATVPRDLIGDYQLADQNPAASR